MKEKPLLLIWPIRLNDLWIWLIFALSMIGSQVSAQDSLVFADVKSHLYEFSLANGEMEGEGADFLKSEFANNSVILLGELHGQSAISKFTSALLPLLSSSGNLHFGLEVGPIAGGLLNNLNSPNVIKQLKELNEKYLFDDDGDICTPIPFFRYLEDAQFLEDAKRHGWNVFGIDQEFFDSYEMLFDVMYKNLKKKKQRRYSQEYRSAIDSVRMFYKMEVEGEGYYTHFLTRSETISRFLTKMGVSQKNKPVIQAFNRSVALYKMADDKNWYGNYEARIAYMKENLKKHLRAVKHDFKNDKLLMKMGRLHLSNGTSTHGFNEIGNTLHQLNDYNGGSTLGIGFDMRYYMGKNGIADLLDNKRKAIQDLKGFKQFGKKHIWVILDLRPLRKAYDWYPYTYKGKLNSSLQAMTHNYDILIIPPAHESPKPNY